MRKNKLARQVRKAYCQDTLARICTLREDRFGRAFGMQTVQVSPPVSSWSRKPSGRPEDYYHFRDHGASVLAVAHLDTVVAGDRRAPRFAATEKGPLITSGALDDRLGAYVILDLLPKLGIRCDWLLTVGEESGASTAEFFEPGKDYDHVIEFDRGGTDVVMYQYEDRASREAVEAAGAAVGSGSFSDIACLEQLNAKCFNWGVGYRGNYHSEAGYAYLRDTFAMVAKYLRFHEQNAGLAMPHDPDSWKSGSRSYDRWDDYYGDCDVCLERGTVDTDTWYCRACGACQDCFEDRDDCLCYVPKHIRDEAADAGSSDIRVTSVTPGRMTSTPARPDGGQAELPGSWSDDGGRTWHSTDEDSGRPEDEAGRPLATVPPWHETSGTVTGHLAGPWGVPYGCLRCAARYPHELVNTPAEPGREEAVAPDVTGASLAGQAG